MKNKEFREADLPHSCLKLDEDNFRIDQVGDQRSAMFALLEQQRAGEKIYNLAKDIVDRGSLAPGERLIVVPNDEPAPGDEDLKEVYVVMEGNRRTLALRLLESPDIIASEHPALSRKFKALSSRAPASLFANVPCVILPDRDTAMEWVELKHSTQLDGAGPEKWDATATARFSERRGEYRKWRIALEHLKKSGIETEEINDSIAGKTTAVERVLNSGATRKVLGLLFRTNDGIVEFENGNEAAGTKLIHAMMARMANKDFTTNMVHALPDRETFILDFAHLSVAGEPAPKGSAVGESNGDTHQTAESDTSSLGGQAGTPAPWPEDNATQGEQHTSSTEPEAVPTQAQPAKGKHPLQESTNRKYLASNARAETYHVKDERLNSLYRELRRLEVARHPNLAAVSTRVFLELSCDAYLLDKGLPVPPEVSNKGAKDWTDAKLRQKIEAVVKDLDPNKANRSLHQVRKALGSDDHLHSVKTLHGFIHDIASTAVEREILTIWNRYHPLFALIHQ